MGHADVVTQNAAEEKSKPYHGSTRIRRDRESGEFTAETRRRGEEPNFLPRIFADERGSERE
jgi:hypothetical protein